MPSAREQVLARKQIIITDLTRMRDFDVCIAGVDVTDPHVCLRPLLSSGPGHPTLHPDERWLRSAAQGPIQLFSVVDLEDFGNRPNPPHTEDWAVGVRGAKVTSALPIAHRRLLLESLQMPAIDELFGAPVGWNLRDDGLRTGGHVQPGSGRSSLGTLNVGLERFHVTQDATGAVRYYAFFQDERGNQNRLTVTDLSFRGWTDAVRRLRGGSIEALNRDLRSTFSPGVEVWLRIGLTRPWSPSSGQEAMCYLQITGVHTVPDYLNGAAWHDFQLRSV